MYTVILVIYFILLHIYFPPFLSAGTKNAIDTFISNPLTYWWFIFPLIGLITLLILIIYYGRCFLSSFGRGYRTKKPYNAKISILIASKNEKTLLDRTLNSILASDYPKEDIQIIIITSGSTDGTTDYSNNFAKENSSIDIEVLSENLPKKGKPPALNYGLKYVKNDIVVLYDSGCILEQNTLRNLISPFQKEKNNAVIGPVLVKNWKINKLTRALFLDYAFLSGGGLLFETKNRLGKSAYSFGRNFAVRTKHLRKSGGFNEDSMTEDLYLSVVLNLDGIKILFSPKAKVYEYVPSTWEILKKQRTRWVAGYIYDMPQLMEMKSEEKDGKKIIIDRNMTMMLLGNIDAWIPIFIGFAIFFFLIGEWYLLSWFLSCLIFQFGFLFKAVRKYGDNHFSILFWWPISAYIHLYMFLRQFSLPKEISWDKTPMILEKQEEEVKALSTK